MTVVLPTHTVVVSREAEPETATHLTSSALNKGEAELDYITVKTIEDDDATTDLRKRLKKMTVEQPPPPPQPEPEAPPAPAPKSPKTASPKSPKADADTVPFVIPKPLASPRAKPVAADETAVPSAEIAKPAAGLSPPSCASQVAPPAACFTIMYIMSRISKYLQRAPRNPHTSFTSHPLHQGRNHSHHLQRSYPVSLTLPLARTHALSHSTRSLSFSLTLSPHTHTASLIPEPEPLPL